VEALGSGRRVRRRKRRERGWEGCSFGNRVEEMAFVEEEVASLDCMIAGLGCMIAGCSIRSQT
jgi:hypothetical protein